MSEEWQAAEGEGGKLAANIVHFARALRRAGLKIGPAAVTEAIEAVQAAGVGSRDDFYWTLHAVLINRHEDSDVFAQAFRLFWRPPRLLERLLGESAEAPASERRERKPADVRAAEALFGNSQKAASDAASPEIELDASFSFSERERLRAKDFAQMTPIELTDARKAIGELRLPRDEIRTRRFAPSTKKRRVDPRRTMRAAMRSGGDLVIPQFREPRTVQPPLVVLADISGSMSQYSRIFLHFLHVLTERRRRVHAFLFGTRLTNVTRQMRHRDVDAAIAQASHAVEDWSGGTRIGDTLRVFNRDWSRRVLSQGAIVLLITDGLERDQPDVLATEMERLHKSCRRLIWLNPLLRFEGFEARARGVRAILPHVDEFRPVHSLATISDLCLALGRSQTSYDMKTPRDWLNELHEAA